MKRALSITAVAAACALVALAALSGSAHATYPGATNGRIAFGINVNGNTDVYTARPDGQDLRRLTTDPGFDACAAYSADGRRIAYCSGQGGGPVQVWTMKQNGTDKQQVTHVSGPATSPTSHRTGARSSSRRSRPASPTRDIYVDRQRRQRPYPADEQFDRQRLSRLLAGRHEDRLHEQAHRHLAGLRDERRRLRPDATHLRPAAQRPGARLEPRRLQDRLPRRHARHRRHRQPELGRHLGDERRRLRPAPDHATARPTTAPPGRRTAAASPRWTCPPGPTTRSTPQTAATRRQSTRAGSSSSPAGSRAAPATGSTRARRPPKQTLTQEGRTLKCDGLSGPRSRRLLWAS